MTDPIFENQSFTESDFYDMGHVHQLPEDAEYGYPSQPRWLRLWWTMVRMWQFVANSLDGLAAAVSTATTAAEAASDAAEAASDAAASVPNIDATGTAAANDVLLWDTGAAKFLRRTVAQLSTALGLASKANLNNPAFTGTPTAPTPAAGTNNTQIATTSFVTTSIDIISAANASKRLFDAMTVKPLSIRASLIKQTVDRLQAAGVWDKLDVFYVLAAHTAQAAGLNWIDPGKYAATVNGTMTFAANAGYTGDGSTGYLDTGFIPDTHATKATSASAEIGARIGTITNSTALDFGDNAGNSGIRVRSASEFAKINGVTPLNADVGSSPALLAARIHAGNMLYVYNGVMASPAAATSLGLPTGSLRIGAGNATFSDRQIQYAFFGSALSSEENAAIYAIMEEYLVKAAAAAFISVAEMGGASAVRTALGASATGEALFTAASAAAARSTLGAGTTGGGLFTATTPAAARTVLEATAVGTALLTAADAAAARTAIGATAGINNGTMQATTSGTAIDFTGIPSGVKRITLSLKDVSLSGNDVLLAQLGDSGGIENTGYAGATSGFANGVATANNTTGAPLMTSGVVSAARTWNGHVVFQLMDAATNLWSITSVLGDSSAAVAAIAGFTKATSAVLDRLRLTVSGTNTFDGGSANISWEQ